MPKEEIVKWHNMCCNWGLESEIKEVDGLFSFTAGPHKIYRSLLAPLVAIRYLYESPDIVKKTYEFIEEFPSEDSLNLFQLAHYYTGYYNYNHTFLSPAITLCEKIYDDYIRKFVTRSDIAKNLQIPPPIGEIGLATIFRRSKNPLTDIRKSRCIVEIPPANLLNICKRKKLKN